MDHLLSKLKQLGLGDYESLIYCTLLENSPANATLIAKKCNLSRSSVYTTLSSLIAKGLVSTTYKNEVKQFIAEDDTALEQLLKKEKENLNEKFKTLDLLREGFTFLKKANINIPQIIFFEGQEGLKKIYLSMMRQAKQNDTLYLLRDEFVWQKEWEFIFTSDWHEKIKRIKKEKNISTKLLINNSSREKEKKKLYTSKKGLQCKFLAPKNSIDQFAVYILGDTVSILSLEKNNLVGIKIVNEHLTKNFKNIFEVLWTSARA